MEPINKTMEREDLDTPQGQECIREIDDLVRELDRRGLKVSSWYGRFKLPSEPRSYQWLNRGIGYQPLPGAVDDNRFPWFLYWEIHWVVANTPFRPGERVLDLGGASSLFAFFLATRGVHVTTIDLEPELVENSRRVARAMGWSLESHVLDIRDLGAPASPLAGATFDRVTSICVFEHLPRSRRAPAVEAAAALVPRNGTVSLTFDYLNPARSARIDSPADVHQQFVAPGLRLRGNQIFVDNGKRYLIHPARHPDAPWWVRAGHVVKGNFSPLGVLRASKANAYTFGAVFLEKVD